MRRRRRRRASSSAPVISAPPQARREAGRHCYSAFANGQRYVSKGGPERERFSDPDASWGHRSAVSTRAAGSFYGYKVDMAVDVATGLPLAWQVRTAKRNESMFVAPLLDTVLARGFKPETCAMDKGYDHPRVYAECEERGCEPVIPLRGAKGKQVALPLALGGRYFPRIARHTERFRNLYRGRAAVEREFGNLKKQLRTRPVACSRLGTGQPSR